ncbi:putative ATP-dependent RNA helicase prh1, partial [Dissostichus eleginoides]
FFHLADPLHHYTPTPTYLLTCMRAHTLTHSLLPLIPLSLTRESMEELLLRHSAGMLLGRY